MPPSSEILRLLETTASDLAWLAAAWHAALITGIAAAVGGWRPSSRVAASFLIAPVLSVAVAAFAYGNPFNGISFGLLAAVLAVSNGVQRSRPLERGPRWASVLGAALILYGACYPALTDAPWYRVPFVAPLGVVPCPTLAAVAGLTLVANGFGQRGVPALLALWSAFYAVFGLVRLGVLVDLGLLAAPLGLISLLIQHGRDPELRLTRAEARGESA